jgi:hypothetical protein
MKRAYAQPASSFGKTALRSTSLPSHNLTDALLRNMKDLGDTSPSFTRFETGDNLGVAVSFFRRVIVLRFGWVRGGVEHLHDVKSGQPDIEARCGFEPPMGH